MKTTIKKANWKSKMKIFDDKYINITTTLFYQSEDAFIDTDSKFLCEMICAKFFRSFQNKKIDIQLQALHGELFPKLYRVYIYNAIYKELTKKDIEYDIFDITDPEKLYERSCVEIHLEDYQKRLLEIIELLEIDFKEESKIYNKPLFNKKGKKDFYLESVEF